MIEIKYWDDDPNHGIIYDWKYLKKEYKKLKCPKGVYDPFSVDFTKAAYAQVLSDRSQGKTTNPLLLGLIMYRDYGTVTHVIRQSEEICQPKNIMDMCKTILEFNYISKIFGGKWNSIRYRGKRWRLTFVDDDGNVLEESAPVIVCFGLDESQKLKSAYNAPRGDLVIFDEFINESFGVNDFIRFMDLLKTIFRDRRGYVYMLSNTIDKNSQWFDEFCVRDAVEELQAGESQYVHTELGTTIFLQILSPVKTKQRLFINQWLFGFPNKKLAAITGADTWSMTNYQHIPSDKDTEHQVIFGRLYLLQSGKYVKLKLVHNNKVGYCVYVHPATKIYDDSIILTHGDILDKRYMFGFGSKKSKVLDLVWRLYEGNRFYYARNSEGSLVKSYISITRTKIRDMMK